MLSLFNLSFNHVPVLYWFYCPILFEYLYSQCGVNPQWWGGVNPHLGFEKLEEEEKGRDGILGIRKRLMVGFPNPKQSSIYWSTFIDEFEVLFVHRASCVISIWQFSSSFPSSFVYQNSQIFSKVKNLILQQKNFFWCYKIIWLVCESCNCGNIC